MKKRLCKVLEFWVKLLLSGVATYLVGMWAIESAHEQRGYFAIGGEYVLLIVVFMVSFFFVGYLVERRPEWK